MDLYNTTCTVTFSGFYTNICYHVCDIYTYTLCCLVYHILYEPYVNLVMYYIEYSVLYITVILYHINAVYFKI